MKTTAEPDQRNQRHDERQRARIFDRRIILKARPDKTDVGADDIDEDKMGQPTIKENHGGDDGKNIDPFAGLRHETAPAPSSRWQWRRRIGIGRSEERRAGKEGGSTCRSRWSPVH